jgi:6-pyruvoyl-tetrahydropterin synthase
MRGSLTRQVSFRATHQLRLATLSEAENRTRFGWTVDGHGHDYTCAATVGGPPAADTGMIMDLALLDRILSEEVVRPLDGRHLNDALPECARGEVLPVCEVIAAWCFRRIAPRLPEGVHLDRVRVAEDSTLHADCTGPA